MVQRAYRGDSAASYDAQRFQGAGGRYVNQREMALVAGALAGSTQRVLDVPAGTGRASLALAAEGHSVVSMDLSPDMLDIVRSRTGGAGLSAVQTDAAFLPVKAAAFDACVSLRFLHFFGSGRRAQQVALLREFGRVVRPGGTIVFDTNRWSPRHLRVRGRQLSTVYFHRDDDLRAMARDAGLEIIATQEMFFLAPMLYNGLPGPIVRFLELLEGVLPSRWRVRVFWICTNREAGR